MSKINKIIKRMKSYQKVIGKLMRILYKLITLISIIIIFIFSNKVSYPDMKAGLTIVISILVGVIVMIFITSAIEQSVENPKLKISQFLKYFFL